MAIKITCTKEEKLKILKALHKADICPFEDACREMPKGNFRGNHDICCEANIEWTITDEPVKDKAGSSEEGKFLTDKQVADAAAKAFVQMVIKNPLTMLIRDDLTTLSALTTAILFKEDE